MVGEGDVVGFCRQFLMILGSEKFSEWSEAIKSADKGGTEYFSPGIRYITISYILSHLVRYVALPIICVIGTLVSVMYVAVRYVPMRECIHCVYRHNGHIRYEVYIMSNTSTVP